MDTKVGEPVVKYAGRELLSGPGSESQLITAQLQAEGGYRIPLSSVVGSAGFVGYINQIISNGVKALGEQFGNSTKQLQGLKFVVVEEKVTGDTPVANGTVADAAFFG